MRSRIDSGWGNRDWRWMQSLVTFGVILFMMTGSAMAIDEHGWWYQRNIEIEVLSSSADLVSGGEARVLISLPWFLSPHRTRIKLNDVDITDTFSVTHWPTRFEGVIDNLVIGENDLRV